jgi:plasmid maintenance system antidote protein VapI
MKAFPALEPEFLLTEEELVVELASKVVKRGDHGRVAYELGVSQPSLSNILTGGRPIGAGVAAKLGYRKVTRFEKIR